MNLREYMRWDKIIMPQETRSNEEIKLFKNLFNIEQTKLLNEAINLGFSVRAQPWTPSEDGWVCVYSGLSNTSTLIHITHAIKDDEPLKEDYALKASDLIIDTCYRVEQYKKYLDPLTAGKKEKEHLLLVLEDIKNHHGWQAEFIEHSIDPPCYYWPAHIKITPLFHNLNPEYNNISFSLESRDNGYRLSGLAYENVVDGDFYRKHKDLNDAIETIKKYLYWIR